MIQAKIVADSLSPFGERLTTLEVVMPRYILAEFNTHRILSKNSASSRAIPIKKMLQTVRNNGFKPYAWQKDHSGMQGTEYHTDKDKIEELDRFWESAKDEALTYCELFNYENVTKQLANRLLEPFMYHKVLVSGTEWENFFTLRCPQYEVSLTPDNSHVAIGKSWKEFMSWKKDNMSAGDFDTTDVIERLKLNKGQADIHMMFLAEAIYDAMNESTPKKLKEGEWHIPYSDQMEEACYDYFMEGGERNTHYLTDEEKIKVSIARCARLSYQTLGDNPVIDYEKDLALYETLSTSGHWSPFEHVAKVMTKEEYNTNIKGVFNITHYEPEYEDLGEFSNKSKGWCRNFKGFIQYRELLDN